MKLKLNNLIFIGIIIQLISTQGVLTFLFFDLFGLWELKSIVHPISFLFIVLFFIFKSVNKIKVTGIELFVLIYYLFIFVQLCINADSLSGIYFGFREVFLIFTLTFIYNQFTLTHSQWYKVLKLLYYLVLINIFLVGLTYFLGPEGFMKLITGRYVWGVDPKYKFQISNYLGLFWRSPGAVGSSGALAYFALFSYILMDRIDSYKFKKYVALFLLFISFTRSAFLAFAIYFFLNFIIQKKNISKIVLIVNYGWPIIIVGLIALSKFGIFSTTSFIMRLEIWFNEINVNFNPIFGGAIGNVGAAVRGEGAHAILDSYWLMMLFSTGIIGILLWLLFFYEKAMNSKQNLIVVLSVIASGFFITISQAIPFLVMFPMIFLKKPALNLNKEHEIK